MSKHIPKELTNYIDNPKGMLYIEHMKMGRWQARGIGVASRQGGIMLHEMLDKAWAKSTRYRPRKDGSIASSATPAPARLLSVEAAAYLEHLERRRLAPDTIQAAARSLAALQLACGDIPISCINEDNIRTLFDVVRWVPHERLKDPANALFSAEEMIQQGKDLQIPQPAKATFELRQRLLNAFFNNRIKARAIEFSFMDTFAELRDELVVDRARTRRQFEDHEIAKIFNPVTFVPWALKYPHRWWAPMIGLYTGMRINEVAQLKVADFVEERGTWCIDVCATIDDDLKDSTGRRSRQRVKGKSSIRRLPIAQPLLDAGILDFLKDIQATGCKRIFPHLSAGVNKKTGLTNARYSQNLKVQFGKYLQGLGFPAGLRFHGFRHAIATDLSNQGFSDEGIALITGHSVSNRVPVLRDNYIHSSPGPVRHRQKDMLAHYKPAVQLPVYRRGQFSKSLGLGARLYP